MRKRYFKAISAMPAPTFKNKEIAANERGRQFFNGNFMDLFDLNNNEYDAKPLADKMRPNNLDEFVGQGHIVAEGSLLRRAIKLDRLGSCIFWGPPGCGKTTLANIIAATTHGNFIKLNAVQSGVADVKKAVEDARTALKLYGKKTYLLLDECHRFNKTQSDSLLPAIDIGTYLVQT